MDSWLFLFYVCWVVVGLFCGLVGWLNVGFYLCWLVSYLVVLCIAWLYGCWVVVSVGWIDIALFCRLVGC